MTSELSEAKIKIILNIYITIGKKIFYPLTDNDD